MSLSKRTRDGFRNFSRRFGKEEAPPSSMDAISSLPQSGARDDVLAKNRGGSTRTPNTTTTNGTRSSGTATTNVARSNGTRSSGTAATTISTNGTANSKGTTGSSTSPYHLRPPILHRKHSTLHATTPDFVLPDLPWLCGTWHVTHSTLPMWKDKRNVRITYTRLAGDKIDDTVTYQKLHESEVHKVHGIDTPKRDGRYTWRGKGLLKVASSKWEVLGWGGGGPNHHDEWVVTYFNRTMFTPAGIDIYSRHIGGLSDATITKLKKGLSKVEATLTEGKEKVGKEEGNFGRLVSQIYALKMDGGRDGDVIIVEDGERIRG